MKYTLGLVAAAMLVSAGGVTAAERSAPTARDIFYSSAQSRDSEWLGIRTSVLLKYTDRKNQIRMAEVSDLKPFRDGDRFRFRVQSNVDGYLYIFLRGARGETQLLFPYERGSGKVRKMQSRFVPDHDWFQFDKKSGTETVYMILSREPLRDIDRLVNGDKRNISASDLERWAGGRASGGQSMLFDEETLEDAGDVGATYFVEKPGERRDYLVRRFELIHNANRASK